MSLISLFATILVLSVPGTSFAQEWTEFKSLQDRFTVNFPGEPEIMEILWASEFGADLPARVYTVDQGPSRYSTTVVDYNLVRSILTEKREDCPPGIERCTGGSAGYSGAGYWKNDVRGALVYTAWQFMQRDVEVTNYMWNYLGQGPEGHELQLINNADQSRTFVSMYMYENRLYIMEATTPRNYPPPGIFTQSIGLLDEAGGRVSIQGGVYFNGAQADPGEEWGAP